MIRKDKEATKSAHFMDWRSYVATWKHPGTDHQCRYLFGADASRMRDIVYRLESGKCFKCGAWYGPETGQLHHIKGGLGRQRCWCQANLEWSCPKCHREQHVQTRWYEKKDSIDQ